MTFQFMLSYRICAIENIDIIRAQVLFFYIKLKGFFVILLTAQSTAFAVFFYVIILTVQCFDGYMTDSDTR